MSRGRARRELCLVYSSLVLGQGRTERLVPITKKQNKKTHSTVIVDKKGTITLFDFGCSTQTRPLTFSERNLKTALIRLSLLEWLYECNP